MKTKGPSDGAKGAPLHGLEYLFLYIAGISNVNWDNLYQCSNVDEAYCLFHKNITEQQ